MRERADLRASYDRVADDYVRRLFDELRHKPLDRELLDRFAERVRDVGAVADVGCGPGHVARYLHERGVRVTGIDLSPGMIARARGLTPLVEFREGDMAALGVADGTWAGITAFYSLIHIAREEMVDTLRELRRVLRPGGLLLIAFHVGHDTMHLDEWMGQPVRVDFHFFAADEMTTFLRAAGFEIESTVERDPYPGVEHPSRRAYILATVPDGDTASM